MYAVVFVVNPYDREGSEKKLTDAGFTKREVWVKHVWKKDETESELMRLGVAQFAVTDFWGAGPD